jgi:glycosyltransferase involved in cell wall biosynthesis
MKLLVITNIPTPYRIAFFNVLCQKLTSENNQFKVLYCSDSEPDRHWTINFSEQKFDYKILRGFHYTIGSFFLHFNPSVLKETKNFNPDFILYAGSWNMPTVILSLIFNFIFNKKYIKIFWSEGHDSSILYKTGVVPKIRKLIQNLFDGFAVPNERSKTYLFDILKLRKKPIFILPNTVDGSFFTKSNNWSNKDSRRIKEKFKLSVDSKILIQVAQIEDRKGVKELVEYWQKITNKNNFQLVLIGEGSLKNELIIATKSIKSIRFLGNKSNEDVRDLLFASDVFILLTKNDPNPLTLIEASFAKLPILTTRFAGNCNEIVIGENGIILDEITFDNFKIGFEKICEFSLLKGGDVSCINAQKNFDINVVSSNFVLQLKNHLI